VFRIVFDSEPRPPHRKMPSVPGLKGADIEKAGYLKYLSARPQHPRYKYLSSPRALDIVAFEDRKPVWGSRLRPNLTLTKLFSIQAAKLLVRDASAGPNGQNNLLLLAAAECLRGNPTSVAPAALNAAMAKAADWKAEFKRDIAGMRRRDVDRMQDYFDGKLRLAIDDAAVESEASLQPYLLAAALEQVGLNIQDYAFNNNRLASFQDGANGLFALDSILRETLKEPLQLDHIPSCAEINRAL
jgi:hypothetical protein